MDAALARFLTEMGPRWAQDVVGNGDRVFDFYEADHRAQMAKGPSHQPPFTISYGTDERQQVDIYLPLEFDPKHARVILFVHGGAFIRGERNRTPFVYSNVCRDLCRHGFIVANAGYRLAPQAAYPEGARDVASATIATQAALGEQQIPFERFFLMGHSAGGTHCATALFDPIVQATHPSLRQSVSGLIMVSPRLAADNDPRNPNAAPVKAYFGEDASAFAARSPLTHLKAALAQSAERRLPIFLAMAEYENPLLQDYADQIKQHTDYHFYPVHNHMSIIAQMDSAESPLGEAISNFCRA
ncbi:MAG: alpha/beta hydrolase [Burkholderiaceae bacterium]|nr:alpha/beta hydrolase [Burkholderiaceae bacterium]